MIEQNNKDKDAKIDKIFQLLEASANGDFIGEPISQLEHALQAAKFAADAKADEDLVIACLLHDIGHLCDERAQRMDNIGVLDHETVGGNFLKSLGLNRKVVQLVAGHVQAKRYAVTKKGEAYYNKLSPASKQTLAHQNGLMSKEEMHRYEQEAMFKAMLRLREYDEKAKLVDYKVPPLEAYRDMIKRVML